MSGGIIKTTQMVQRGEDTVNNAADLSVQINNLISSVDGLMSVWTSGGGHDSFSQEFNMERDYLESFAKKLTGHGEDISDAARILDNADADAADDAKRIGSITVD